MATFDYAVAFVYEQAGASGNYQQNVLAAQQSGTLSDNDAGDPASFEIGETVSGDGDPFNPIPGKVVGTIIDSNGATWVVVEYDDPNSGPQIDDHLVAYGPAGADALALPNQINTSNDLDLTAFCFGAGTRIATPRGDRAVEELKDGDPILTADGLTIAVKWIGRQSISRLVGASKKAPVRIRAGALGDGLPHSDLTVTADHGMVLDGLLINASALVNGSTIDFVPMAELADSFTVYHIETEAHDVILANGTPAETFVDYAGRRGFDNYGEYLELYGAEWIIPEMPRPRISTQRLLPETIRARLGIADDADGRPAFPRSA